MRESSPRGTRLLDVHPMGATGKVGGSIGKTRLEALEFGPHLRFTDCDVRVLESLPTIDDKRLFGILGMDQFRRSGALALEFSPEGGATATLSASGSGESDGWSTPFSLVHGIPFVMADAWGTQGFMLLDMGSSWNFLMLSSAKRIGAEYDETETLEVRGLGGQKKMGFKIRTPRLSLAGQKLEDLELWTSELPVLRGIAPSLPVGILGGPFFQSLARVEFDFGQGLVRFRARG